MNLEARVADGPDGNAQFVSMTFHGEEEMRAAVAMFRFLAGDIERVLGASDV
jgi:hypothetical protein